MSESLKICAIGIIFATLCIIVKHFRAEFLIPTKISATIIIFGIILVLIDPIIQYLHKLMGLTLPLEYIQIAIKALAISFTVQLTSEICRDCGENNIATGIETVGKIELIIISLPLIDNIISMSEEILSW